MMTIAYGIRISGCGCCTAQRLLNSSARTVSHLVAVEPDVERVIATRGLDVVAE
jgi:hypothetical protein